MRIPGVTFVGRTVFANSIRKRSRLSGVGVMGGGGGDMSSLVLSGKSVLSILGRFGRTAVLGLAALLLFQAALYAQTTGTLTGTVYDQTGAVVPNARVTLKNQASGVVRETTSNEVGYFTFASIIPGTYALRVEVEGFKAWERPDIVMNPGDKRHVSDINLEVGIVATEVTVSATAGQITPVSSGERSAVLSAKDIQNLSLQGRDVTELIRVLPGMSVFTGGGTANTVGYDPTVAGFTNAVGTGYTANGAVYRGGTDLISDSAHIIDAGCNCISTQMVNADMVAEVKVQTSNFSADSAKGPVVVNAVGKSGTADYHGQLYLHGRDSSMNSTDWYLNRLGLKKPVDRYLYPGGSVGGPVPGTDKKMLFWAGYEYYWQKLPAPAPLTSYVPTLSNRRGDFSSTAADNVAFCAGAGQTMSPWAWPPRCRVPQGYDGLGNPIPASGIIPQSSWDPGGVAFYKMFPPPNTDPRTNPGGYNYVLPYVTRQNGWIFRTRLDYNFTEKTMLYVSYNAQRQTDEVPIHLWWIPTYSIPFPGGMSSKDNSNTISGRFLHIFSPSLTNEVIATFAYINYPLKPNDPSASSRATLGYPYQGIYRNGDPQIPSISNQYWLDFPHMDQPDLFYPGKTFVWKKFTPTFEDNLTLVYRTHTFKFGLYIEKTANYQGSWGYTNGEATFTPWGPYGQLGTNTPMANILLGVPDYYIENNIQAITNMSYLTIAGYAMDTWKATRRLTLDLGLRIDHLGPWQDDGNIWGVFGAAVWIPQRFAVEADQGRELPGISWMAKEPGIPNGGTPSRFAFVSPRVGAAYDLFGTGKTVLRGGWGMYRWHDQWNFYGGALQVAIGARQFNTGSLRSGMSLAQIQAFGLATGGKVGGLASGAYGLNPLDDEQPLTYTYNFTISQRMPWRTLLEIAYVGNRSKHLLLQGDLMNLNIIPLGALFKPDPITNILYPDPNSTAIPLANFRVYGTRLISSGPPLVTQPGYGDSDLNITQHKGYANYNGLQVSWARQTGRVVYNLNYTWSKAMGICGTTQLYCALADSTNWENNYGVLSIDRTHVFNASYMFDLGNPVRENPFLKGLANGWTIAGITTWQSGPNMQALWNSNFGFGGGNEAGTVNINSRTWLGTPDVNLQPILTCDPTQGLAKDQYINAKCFAVPPQGTNGPFMFPYYMRGPAFFNSDLSVYKTFTITETQNIQFRFSAFNFLNHPLPSLSPSGSVPLSLSFTSTGTTPAGPWTLSPASSRFGYADVKLGRRVFEISIRYSF